MIQVKHLIPMDDKLLAHSTTSILYPSSKSVIQTNRQSDSGRLEGTVGKRELNIVYERGELKKKKKKDRGTRICGKERDEKEIGGDREAVRKTQRGREAVTLLRHETSAVIGARRCARADTKTT